MLSLDQGAAMHHLASAFEDRGYRWAYRTINSQAFLHQRRERVFFVATKNDLDPADVLFEGDVAMPSTVTSLRSHAHGFYWTEGTRGLGWAPDAVPTLKNGSTVGIPSPPAILRTNGTIVKPDLRDAERLQGFPADWTKPAEGGRPRDAFDGRSSETPFPCRLPHGSASGCVLRVSTTPAAIFLGRRIGSPGRERLASTVAVGTRWESARSRCSSIENPSKKFLEHPGTPPFGAGDGRFPGSCRGFLSAFSRRDSWRPCGATSPLSVASAGLHWRRDTWKPMNGAAR